MVKSLITELFMEQVSNIHYHNKVAWLNMTKKETVLHETGPDPLRNVLAFKQGRWGSRVVS